MSDDDYDVKTLDDVLKIVAKFVVRDRKLVKVLFVSFLLDILLTVGIGYGAVHLHTVTQQQAMTTCLSGNTARAANKHLWDELISLSKVKTPSPALLQFEHYLKAATKPRNCSATQ